MSYFALVKSTIVQNVVRQDVAPTAASQGVDLVENVDGIKCEPQWIRQGPRQYVAPPPAPETVAASSIDSDLLQAIAALRVERDKNYAGLTTAQALAALRSASQLHDRVLIGICRKLLGRFDGTD